MRLLRRGVCGGPVVGVRATATVSPGKGQARGQLGGEDRRWVSLFGSSREGGQESGISGVGRTGTRVPRQDDGSRRLLWRRLRTGNRAHERAYLLRPALAEVADRHGEGNGQGQSHPRPHLLEAPDGVVLEPQDVIDAGVEALHGRALSIRPGEARAGAWRGQKDPVVGLQRDPDWAWGQLPMRYARLRGYTLRGPHRAQGRRQRGSPRYR